MKNEELRTATASNDEWRSLISQETIERVRRDNSFDFLRYLFAFSLILVHFCTLTETEQFWVISGQTRVKAFFTITGFLVVYSYLRRGSLSVYVRKRFLRIVPAYVTVIIVSLIVGSIFSQLPVQQYITDTQTYEFLGANLSFLNYLQPALPGLFTQNYETAVNGSLWSMKFEVLFYVLVPFIVWLMRRYHKLTILAVIFLFHMIWHGILDYLEDHNPDISLYAALNHGSFNTIIYFFSGTVLLLYFDWFCRYVKWILPLTIMLLVAWYFVDFPLLNYIEPLLFSAVIIGVAYFCRPLNFLQHHDNISYGLYLYHYPIIQVLVQYKLHQYNIYLAFIVTLLLTILMAALSWRFIEKPLLKKSA